MSADVTRHIAIDLGASSGRVALGTLQDSRLSVDVVHRFPNGALARADGLYWNVTELWREVLHGLRLAARQGPVDSVGVDSWAVDYALLDEQGQLLDGVRHYRDPRTDGVMEDLLRTVPRETLYEHTGIQFLPFNTVYQLVAQQRRSPDLLARTRALLLVPDLLHYWLSGRRVAERTNASTTQLYDPRQGDWSAPVLQACGLPAQLLPPIVAPGSDLGEVCPELAHDTGLRGTRVIAPATHDTASAVAAVPASGPDWAYVSSGTWSLVGVETPAPVISPRALQHNLTNEAGIHGTTRLLKNVMGLWIVQECRRAWGELDFAALYADAAQVPAHGPLIDPDDLRFLPPGTDMPLRVQTFCAQTGQSVPQTPAQITRCILESLACKTAEVLEELEAVTGRAIRTVHVVGGGSQIALLNRLIADAAQRTVVAGPVEATLMGNLLVQAEARGRIPVGKLRETVRASVTLETFVPGPTPTQRARFARVRAATPAP
ncbi:rhamnulokinase [Deinobacterium chartae]|uniref:Rhamnulokinase n=1 Tax=Deinobacterium chartae TaxID=521158 RepID=A0A841I5J7_9DEIO|nr:rhamnulokinase family protein [Deinobacterium chartae]MBB6099710.1 rhamnulokinase [Deinobacterium chartae]